MFTNIFSQEGISLKGLKEYNEAIRKAGIDFEVEKVPLYSKVPTFEGDQFLPVPDVYQIKRTDNHKHLGVCSDKYKVIQNRDAFAIANDFIQLGARFENGGIFRDGAVSFLQLKVGEFQIKNDPVKTFLLIVNSHNGKFPLSVIYTPIRVVCENTLTTAIQTVTKENVIAKIRHTQLAEKRVEEAKKILVHSNRVFINLKQIYGEMAGFKMTGKDLKEFLHKVFGVYGKPEDEISTKTLNLENEIVKVFETSPAIVKVPEAHGTLWGAFNAVSEYYEHHNDRIKDKLFSTAIDTNSKVFKVRQRAFNVALEMLN